MKLFVMLAGLWGTIFLPLIMVACSFGDSEQKPTVPETMLTADLVFTNGAIYTVNSEQPWAEAVAVKGDGITYVGDNAGVQPFIGPSTEVIDLTGKMMLPGLHDVHMHPLEAGSSVAGTCLLPPDTDPEEMIELLYDCAPQQIGTEWVLGFGHSVNALLESERLPIEILDEAIPDRPALMMGQTSHSFWANSKALELAGIDESTPAPVGGIILKEPDTGELTGILFDNAGNQLMDMALAPTPELEELHYEGLLHSLAQVAQNGITSIADARTYWTRNYHEVWLRAEEEGTLTARTILGLWAYPHMDADTQLETLKSLYSNDPDHLLRMSQIKLYSDGIVINTTAAVLEAYLIDFGITPDNLGLNYFDQDMLTHYITELETTGFDFHIHAIGDRGVHESLNAIETAMNNNSGNLVHSERRHRLTHLEMIDAADRNRFVELGVIADFQVAGAFTLPSHWPDIEPLIGQRAYDSVPVRSIYDTGATVTLSSDWDVSALSPFVGIQNALMREHQSLPDLDAAIRAYTINGAYLMRQETRTGSIEVGKWADLIVIDQNLFDIAQEQINQTKVLLTLLGGEVVFENTSFFE